MFGTKPQSTASDEHRWRMEEAGAFRERMEESRRFATVEPEPATLANEVGRCGGWIPAELYFPLKCGTCLRRTAPRNDHTWVVKPTLPVAGICPLRIAPK